MIQQRESNKTSNIEYEILDNLDSLFFIFDDKSNIIYVNDAVEKKLSLARKYIIDKPLDYLFEKPAFILKQINKVRDEKQEIFIDSLAIYSPQKRQIIKAHLFSNLKIQSSNNQHVYLEAQAIDISQLSSMDQKSSHMTFIKGIAHEVKNPLGGIRGAAQLLQSQIKNRDQQQFLNIIIKEADRLNLLLDRLSSNAADKKMPFNIHKVLEHVYTLMQSEIKKNQAKNTKQNIIIKRDYDPSLPDILANESALIQVFLNLAINSVQSISEHQCKQKVFQGEVLIRTRLIYDFFGDVKYYKKAIKIDIIDNGPGIEPDKLHSIFEPLISFKNSDKNSGLGLSIAQDIIENHKGKISVNSIPLNKTSFSVYIPYLDSNKKR